MVEKWNITIPALTGDRQRKAYVYLPAQYKNDADSRFPVMYMFDGHNLFSDGEATYGKSWGLSQYLDNTQTPIIIAAVECNHVGHGRLEEYTPVSFTFKDGSRINAKGKKYMDWLVKEFKPYIDGNFRTLSDRKNTAIGGSSMGGLMTLYALVKYGKYFSKGAALSPSLWVNGGEAVKQLLGSAKFRKDTYIYMDYGSREFDRHDSQRSAFAEACASLIQNGAFVTARIVAGGTHSEASWEKQIPYFMNSLGFYPENK